MLVSGSKLHGKEEPQFCQLFVTSEAWVFGQVFFQTASFSASSGKFFKSKLGQVIFQTGKLWQVIVIL